MAIDLLSKYRISRSRSDNYIYTSKDSLEDVERDHESEILRLCDNGRGDLVLSASAETSVKAYELIVSECLGLQKVLRKREQKYRGHHLGLCELKLTYVKGKHRLEGKVLISKKQFKPNRQELYSQTT
ncbi:hypothetical protein J4416_02825 [Candidatus Pacearchaeota archaeon]|nr:hypothetical protein [Candidatus Pacearchaeota archaeon]